ncbi:SRPBCC family protein [Larkinella soli]|uniref:SRPBCC family protein n=1 Tax=Larkinella soli TaxID=1770527 RepID=UPI000FFC21F1|nr:hypothetical protein [Larkinella soli]
MKITIRTTVESDYRQVWAGFTRDLFDALSPPFPPVRVVRFDGCLRGDVVHLELNFLFFRQNWISQIIDQQELPDEIFFIDQGTRLPFFLSYWHHKHRIIRKGKGTVIADEIHFRTPSRLTDFLLYPLMYAQFAYRIPIYRKYFRK